jgi:flagellar biosynthesis/type III secretory pathway ATPase
MDFVADREHRQAAARVREILATYEQNRDLIALGAYKSGSDPRIDRAIAKYDAITMFLRQGLHETAQPEETRKRLLALV